VEKPFGTTVEDPSPTKPATKLHPRRAITTARIRLHFQAEARFREPNGNCCCRRNSQLNTILLWSKRRSSARARCLALFANRQISCCNRYRLSRPSNSSLLWITDCWVPSVVQGPCPGRGPGCTGTNRDNAGSAAFKGPQSRPSFGASFWPIFPS